MMGVTFLYSSGDNGVAGFDNLCIDPATGKGLFQRSDPDENVSVRERPRDCEWDDV